MAASVIVKLQEYRFAIFLLIVIYGHRRLQQTRHYSVLHSRYRDNNTDMVSNLLEESDDDDALIDPTNLESSIAHHRLALGDDDEPLGTELSVVLWCSRKLDFKRIG